MSGLVFEMSGLVFGMSGLVFGCLDKYLGVRTCIWVLLQDVTMACAPARCLVPSTRYWVPATTYVPGTRSQVRTWSQVPGIWCLVRDTLYLVPGASIKHQVPGNWYQAPDAKVRIEALCQTTGHKVVSATYISVILGTQNYLVIQTSGIQAHQRL